MYKTNLQILEEVFPNGTFSLSQPVRESSDGVDDLIDLNPTKEDRFEGEEEREEDGEVEELKRKRRKKKKNPNHRIQKVLIGDSNFKQCGLQGVTFRKATCLNSKDSNGGLADALNFIVQLKNVETVVVSALQNAINDEGVLDWKKTVTRYVLMISTAATKRPDVQFVVLGPFLRTKKSNHGPLLKPILDQLHKEFEPVKNIHVDSGFRVNSSDLLFDGVHLRPRSEARLFAHVEACFTRDWTVGKRESQSGNLQRSVVNSRSQFSDLRSFLQSRTAPLTPFSPKIQSRQSRSVERRHSPGVRCTRSRSRSDERHHSLGVRYSHSDRRSFERRHSPGVRCLRSSSQERSHPSIVKKIENLDECFLEMFGCYPEQHMYFPHREKNNNPKSLSPRSSMSSRPNEKMDFLPRRRSVKERLGNR